MSKVLTTIYLDKEVRDKAKKMGLHISKITENSLRIILERLESLPVPEEKEEPKEKKPMEIEEVE